MKTVRASLTVVSAAAALTGLNACGSSSSSAPPASAPASSAAAPSSSAASPSSSAPASSAPAKGAPAAATGTLKAANQTSDGKSVAVASVKLDAAGKGGWVALHADANGKPGPVIYFVAVPAGSSSKVVIPTPKGIKSGDYWPMLHVDDHVKGTYEFPKVPKADLPAMDNGMVAMQKITVTVK